MKKFLKSAVTIFLASALYPATVNGEGDENSPMSQLTKEAGEKKGFLAKLFSSKDDFQLEEVMIVTEDDTNDRGALRVHLVILYEKEVYQEISKMSARQYFQAIDQLIKDHPDKIKVMEWELIAKKRIIPWTKIETLKDSMTPIGGFVFADYTGSGEFRAKIPNYAKVKITFGRRDFNIDYEDREE